MWTAAINAIKENDEEWISQNRTAFSAFFAASNEEPKGKLNEAALAAHYNYRLFKMFLPTSLNGLELPLQTGSRWIENASALEGNWGWLLAIGVGGAYFADYMSPAVAEKYFLPEDALVAGSGKPDGSAVETEGGSRIVSGSWSYCSGSEQASLFTAVTNTESGIKAVILPVEQVRIRRDWNAIGLPLTCSHTISAEEQEIPRDHFFDLSGSPRPSGYPLASYPFMLFARACFVPVVAGISRAFWLEVSEFLSSRGDVWKKYQPERFAFVAERIRNYKESMEVLRGDFYKALENSWKHHLSGKDIFEQKVTHKGLTLADFCFESCAEILPKLGMQVLEKEHPLQLLWQDLQTARQHSVFHLYDKK